MKQMFTQYKSKKKSKQLHLSSYSHDTCYNITISIKGHCFIQ